MLTNKAKDYLLIIGNGRSGTNWLLSMLNASPITHCRNEPHLVRNSPFHEFPKTLKTQEDSLRMQTAWAHFLDWESSHMGERDPKILTNKNYLHPISCKAGLDRLISLEKARKLTSFLFPPVGRSEWKMPWWLGEQKKMEQAYTALKVNDLRAWYVKWLFHYQPDQPILHIIRHPGGQLNSGIKRFFSKLNEHDLERERELYVDILKTAIDLQPKWSKYLQNVDSYTLIEAVAWFWRFNNEEIYCEGIQHSNYKCVVYESLVDSPLQHAEDVYNFCGLNWNDNIESSIKNKLNESVWGKIQDSPEKIAGGWKSKLDSKYQVLADQVLEDSVMKDWW